MAHQVSSTQPGLSRSGKTFLVEFKTMIPADYSIKVTPIASRIPQGNSILERSHQTIGKIISHSRYKKWYLMMRTPGIETHHLPCPPYLQPYIIQRNTPQCN